MKVRHGFISNSSSSSFIIKLSDLTADQLGSILNLDTPEFNADPWRFEVENGTITGSTWMDNFSMSVFLVYIGVDDSNIEWGDMI